jgi:probable F420-dependent oxidoreductase
VTPNLRFGIALSTSAAPGADPAGDARAIEELGFDLLTVSDHLHGSHPTFETWTVLSWAAAATSRIRLATTVLGLPYRPPPVVAKMAESLHRLSRGRLILGLGGGGSDQEFEAFGLGPHPPRDKVDGLEEAIRVIRGMWTNETFTFEGRLYSVHEAHIEPKPNHDTPIPIWTGSYGQRSLEVTGRLADGWNPSMAYVPPEDAPVRRDVVRRAAAEAGRDPDDVTCSYNVSVFVDEAGQSNPRIVAGPPEQVAERLASFVRLGFTTLIFWARGGPEGRERLAREVLPLVRAAVEAD